MQTKGQLVQTYTKDDLLLNAFYIEGDKSKPVLIHIHGFEDKVAKSVGAFVKSLSK